MKKDLRKDLKIKIAILTIALYVASNSVISGTLVFMQRDFGISITNAESLINISSITSIITIFLSEKITRKIGMKNCVMVGLFLVGLSSLLPIIHTSYISVVISRLIMGAGVGLFNGHSANYINTFYQGDEAYRLHGIRNSTEFISQMVFLFMAGLLMKIHWKYAFLVYFIAFFIMAYFNKVISEVDTTDKTDVGKFKINRHIFLRIFCCDDDYECNSPKRAFSNYSYQSKRYRCWCKLIYDYLANVRDDFWIFIWYYQPYFKRENYYFRSCNLYNGKYCASFFRQ